VRPDQQAIFHRNERLRDGQTLKAYNITHESEVRLQVLSPEPWDFGSIHNADKDGRRGLHRAASKGNLKLVKWLVEKKADINAKDHYGQTALHEAAYEGHLKIVRFLVENNADVNVLNIFGTTALKNAMDQGESLGRAARAEAEDYEGIVKLLKAKTVVRKEESCN
jgi:Ankyrin repeats (many copies)